MTTTATGIMLGKGDSAMQFRRVPNAGTVLASMQYPHSGDAHLWVVLVRWINEHKMFEYGTWLYNSQTHGYSLGYYYVVNGYDVLTNHSRAYIGFAERCSQKVQDYCGWTR